MSAKSDERSFLDYYSLGVDLSEQRKWGEAVAAYRKAVEINPSCADAHHLLGRALRSMGKLSEAIAAYQTAIEINPYLPLPHIDLGNAFREQGMLDEAIAAYQTAIGIHPDHPLACSSLGTALMEQGALDLAVAMFLKVIDSHPRYTDAYVGLGDALQAQGNVIKAITVYRQAVELDSHHPLAHGNLESALIRLGREERGRKGTVKNPRMAALAQHLGVEMWQVLPDRGDHGRYRVVPILTREQVADECCMPSLSEYLVLTESEADTLARKEAAGYLWTLDVEMLLRHIRFRYEAEARALVERIKAECDNPSLRALLLSADELLDDCFAVSGRGRFLAPSDWKERREGEFCIYLKERGTHEHQRQWET